MCSSHWLFCLWNDERGEREREEEREEKGQVEEEKGEGEAVFCSRGERRINWACELHEASSSRETRKRVRASDWLRDQRGQRERGVPNFGEEEGTWPHESPRLPLVYSLLQSVLSFFFFLLQLRPSFAVAQLPGQRTKCASLNVRTQRAREREQREEWKLTRVREVTSCSLATSFSLLVGGKEIRCNVYTKASSLTVYLVDIWRNHLSMGHLFSSYRSSPPRDSVIPFTEREGQMQEVMIAVSNTLFNVCPVLPFSWMKWMKKYQLPFSLRLSLSLSFSLSSVLNWLLIHLLC